MVPGVGWGGGMGRDESALMFCKILPSSSILSCFLCLNLFLTGGDRMFSLKKSFLELQKSYRVSCGKLAFRLKVAIFFFPALKSFGIPHCCLKYPFSLGPIIQQCKAESAEVQVLLLTCAWRESSCLQESWAAAVKVEPCPWHHSHPDPRWAWGSASMCPDLLWHCLMLNYGSPMTFFH